MAVYNGKSYLTKSVQSILQQDFLDFEFIIIDDGCTDGSSQLLAEFAALDDRIRLFPRPNEGLTRSLIFGCNQARGEYVARHDADDVSLPGRLRAQYALLSIHPNLALVSSWVRYIGPENENLELVTRPTDFSQATHDFLHNRQGPPAHGSVMFRKSAYELAGGYRPEFYYGQDSDLWLRLCEVGEIGYVSELLYLYRLSAGSISVSRRDVQRHFGEIGRACYQARSLSKDESFLLRKAGELALDVRMGLLEGMPTKANSSNGNYFLAANLSDHGHPSARNYLWKVLRKQPMHWRAWVRLVGSCLLLKRKPARRQEPQ